MNSRPDISNFIIMGDSLSDRGTLYHRYLLGFIPMSWVSGLKDKSPDGSFTNGFPWSNHLTAAMASEFTIKKIAKYKKYDVTDISDAVINQDKNFKYAIKNFYHLNDDLKVDYNGVNFVRTYAEGGLTAYDYKWMPSKSINRFFTRLVLPCLADKRQLLFADDKILQLSDEHKRKTLIIEWSGANDLITVNQKPSKAEVDAAIEARMKNVTELMANGYEQFVLFNLPDLSLTPRFQAKKKKGRVLAHDISIYFNEQLQLAVQDLGKIYPNCNIDVFDMNAEFTNMYQHPEQFDIDADKLHQPFITSKDFKVYKGKRSPSKGYMFWDDIHPTSDLHALIAYKFCEIYANKFNMIAPDINAAKREKMVLRQQTHAQLTPPKTYEIAKSETSRHRLFKNERNPMFVRDDFGLMLGGMKKK